MTWGHATLDQEYVPTYIFFFMSVIGDQSLTIIKKGTEHYSLMV